MTVSPPGFFTAHETLCLLRIITPSMTAWPPILVFFAAVKAAKKGRCKIRMVFHVSLHQKETGMKGQILPARSGKAGEATILFWSRRIFSGIARRVLRCR